MQKQNSQGWQQTMSGCPNMFHNPNFSQNKGGGSADSSRRDGGPPPSSSSFVPQYVGNSMCPPPHQHQMFPPHMQQMQSSGMSMNMMTLSPHQMCMLQRENPEAYTLIQQQRLEIYQHRVQLDKALKEVSRLRKELDEVRSTKEHDEGNTGKEKKPDVENNQKAEGEGGIGNSENVPPAINLRKTRSNSPSSQLTDTTQDSLPAKKRILEAAQNSNNNHNNNENSNNNSSNYGEDLHPSKKMKASLPDLARVAATLTSVTSPLHKGVSGQHPSVSNTRRTALPDLATVAARLSAATSPKFNEGNNCSRRRYINSNFAF